MDPAGPAPTTIASYVTGRLSPCGRSAGLTSNDAGALRRGDGRRARAALALHGERESARWATGLAAAFAGVVVVVLGSGQFVSVSDARGALIALGAPVSFALYNVLLQPLLERHGVIRLTAAAASLVGTLALLPLARPSTFTSLGTMSPRDLGLVLYLGVVCTLLGYLGWNAGLRGLGSTRAVSYTYAIPPLAVAIGAVTLAEPVGLRLLVGGGVIVLGVALAQQAPGRDRQERAPADPAVIPET